MAENTTAAPTPSDHGDHSVGEKCAVFSLDQERVLRAQAALPASTLVQDIADTFKTLAHPTRVKLIRAMATGEMCVCELSEVVGLSISATSHQLHQLRALRLVRARTSGKQVYYALRDPFLLSLLDDCTRHLAVSRESSI